MTTERAPAAAASLVPAPKALSTPLPTTEKTSAPRPRRSPQREQRRPAPAREESPPRRRAVLLCREPAESPLWLRVREESEALARRGNEVHLFCAEPVAVEEPVQVHALGAPAGDDLVAQAHEFARRVRAAAAGLDGGAPVSALAYEWGSIPALLALGAGPRVLCLETLERQRSDDMSRPLSVAIEEVERNGLAAVQHVVVRSADTAEQVRRLLPDCAGRLVQSRWVFPSHEFAPVPDPGEVKARYHVGPVDPTILFIGDLDWRHGPDLLVKALPPVLKNNPQARLVIAGEGEMLWPLKVQSRYMLLDHAVRIVGDVSGQPARELIAAADLVAVPSRERTEDWQVLAGWAAERPVVATHEVAGHFCVHEEDCVLIYSNQGSCVWGIERLLYDPALARRIGMRGRQRLEELHGWGGVAAQIEELLFSTQPDSAQL